jgi:hypothetical protein
MDDGNKPSNKETQLLNNQRIVETPKDPTDVGRIQLRMIVGRKQVARQGKPWLNRHWLRQLTKRLALECPFKVKKIWQSSTGTNAFAFLTRHFRQRTGGRVCLGITTTLTHFSLSHFFRAATAAAPTQLAPKRATENDDGEKQVEDFMNHTDVTNQRQMPRIKHAFRFQS